MKILNSKDKRQELKEVEKKLSLILDGVLEGTWKLEDRGLKERYENLRNQEKLFQARIASISEPVKRIVSRDQVLQNVKDILKKRSILVNGEAEEKEIAQKLLKQLQSENCELPNGSGYCCSDFAGNLLDRYTR